MDEPVKENAKTSKRSRRKPAMEPLGWDEIVSQPGMGGYLSFLNGPVPLPHLQGSGTALVSTPGVISRPDPQTSPDPRPITTPELVSNAGSITGPEVDTSAGVDIYTGLISETADGVATDPAIDLAPGSDIARDALTTPDIVTGPEVISAPGAYPSQRIRIRRCSATHDGHSLGEEVLYQALWKAAHPESAEARTVVIGWRGMSQLCRMTPKNCKINTQRLIRKLALEVLSLYNTPESIGTTYRVYSDQAILQRRRAAGLEWVVRSRGVEFVDPTTGFGIMPIRAHT